MQFMGAWSKTWCNFKLTFRKQQIALNVHNNKHQLQNNAHGYDCKSHWTDSEECNIMAAGGRKLHYLLLFVLAESLGTFEYTVANS